MKKQNKTKNLAKTKAYITRTLNHIFPGYFHELLLYVTAYIVNLDLNYAT